MVASLPYLLRTDGFRALSFLIATYPIEKVEIEYRLSSSKGRKCLKKGRGAVADFSLRNKKEEIEDTLSMGQRKRAFVVFLLITTRKG